MREEDIKQRGKLVEIKRGIVKSSSVYFTIKKKQIKDREVFRSLSKEDKTTDCIGVSDLNKDESGLTSLTRNS